MCGELWLECLVGFLLLLSTPDLGCILIWALVLCPLSLSMPFFFLFFIDLKLFFPRKIVVKLCVEL